MRSYAVHEHTSQGCGVTMPCKDYVTVLSVYGTIYESSPLPRKYFNPYKLY